MAYLLTFIGIFAVLGFLVFWMEFTQKIGQKHGTQIGLLLWMLPIIGIAAIPLSVLFEMTIH